MAGYFFFFSETRIKQFFVQRKIVAASAFVFIGIVVLYFSKTGFNTTVNLPAYYHHTIKYGGWAAGVLLIWTGISYLVVTKFQASRVEKFLAWMGKDITLIYVVQWLIIGNLATTIYQTQALNRFPFWLAGILIVTLVISWLLAKTK